MVDDICEVRKEVALVLVCEDSGHAGVVELDVLVVHAHEVNGGVGWDEGCQSVRDDLGDGTLCLLVYARVEILKRRKRTSES